MCEANKYHELLIALKMKIKKNISFDFFLIHFIDFDSLNLKLYPNQEKPNSFFYIVIVYKNNFNEVDSYMMHHFDLTKEKQFAHP